MELLKLVALDQEDLEVISAHLQDAVLRVEDMAYLAEQKRFAAIANRFDWAGALKQDERRKSSYERRRSALRFDRVLKAQTQNVPIRSKDAVLELLAIHFEAKETPAGHVTLFFAGGAAIKLDVECIEAELQDLGPVWSAKSKPHHVDDEVDEEVNDEQESA